MLKKPEEYYTVNADFGDYSGQWFDENIEDEKKANRIPTKEKAEEIAKLVRGKQARVRSIKSEQKKDLVISFHQFLKEHLLLMKEVIFID